MLSMLQAHGLDAGPTQRPLLAGAVSGSWRISPQRLCLWGSERSSRSVWQPASQLLVADLAFAGVLVFGGVLYGGLFQRAASHWHLEARPRGGACSGPSGTIMPPARSS